MPFVDGLALWQAAWSRILDRGQPRNSRRRRSVASAKSFPATEGSELGRSQAQAQAGRQDTGQLHTIAFRLFRERMEFHWDIHLVRFLPQPCSNLAPNI